ncbi:MAG: DUF3667 domain-containing protein [Flavobacteriales bacterium]|nr:DUF3667 domain-containing protein [Flavobacteriales bacterium]
MQPCANCGEPFAMPHCPQCGQKRVQPGIRLGEVMGDFLGGLFNVDAPILFTLRSFFRGPGRLTRAFLAGKRKAFTPPVRFFLFGVAYYYIVRWLLNWDPVDAAVASTTGAAPADTPAMQVNHWMSRNVNLLLPVLLVLLATFDRLLFPRTGLRWVERLVHYLFAAGTYLMVATTLLLFVKLWPPIQLLNFFVILGILMWACIALHRRHAWNVVKAVAMMPVTFVLYIMVSMLIVSMLLHLPVAEVFQRPVR